MSVAHQRRQNRCHNPEDKEHLPGLIIPIIIAPAAAEPAQAQHHVGQDRHYGHQRESDHAHANVVIFDMPEFVRHDAGEFVIVHDVEQPARHATRQE